MSSGLKIDSRGVLINLLKVFVFRFERKIFFRFVF